jgi:serine protease SohB
MRPTLDIEQVATGEHWYGTQAQEKGWWMMSVPVTICCLGLMEGRELVGVRFAQRKRLLDRFTNSAAESADRLLLRWLQRGQKPLL